MKNPRTLTRKSITPAQFRNLIFAGRSTFTLENKDTNNYITFKIKQIKKKKIIIPDQFAVFCKSLGDSFAGYRFLGFLNIKLSKFKQHYGTPKDYIGYSTLFWLLRNLENLENLKSAPKLAIYHEGFCGSCGRALTVPHSIDMGIGPECYDHMIHHSAELLRELNIWDDLLTYDDNVRKALNTDPSLWSKIHVPDYIKPEDAFKGHRLLARLDIF